MENRSNKILIMKNFLLVTIGLTVIPLALIAMFCGFNYVLSLLFNEDYKEIQNSIIWLIEMPVILGLIILYFYQSGINLDEDY